MGWGGLERNLQRYAHWMQEAGHEIEVNAVPESPLATSVVAANLPLRFIPRQRRYLPVGAATALKKIPSRIGKKQPSEVGKKKQSRAGGDAAKTAATKPP